jgi:multiple sugar transport system substrate-binding protein
MPMAETRRGRGAKLPVRGRSIPRVRLRWLSLLVLALALTSCGRSADRSAGHRTVIRYWEKWTGFEAEAMRKVVDDFNASQDRIYVDFSSVSQIDRKFMLSTAGGVPPDVAGIWSVSLPIFAENNALTPLDKLAAEAGVRRADYIDAFWQLCSYRDHLWALPSTPASVGLVWNKKMFRAAGLDPERPPRSIAELEDFNRKLERLRPDGRLDRLGFLPTEPIFWNAMWGYWFGATLWDGKAKITIDSPENIAAYHWVQSYPERFGADNLLAFQDGFGQAASPQNPFLSGRLAMELQGVWIYNFIKAYAPPDFEWGVAPFPTADPGRLPAFGLVETDVLVVPAGARHPRESFEFIRYVNLQKPMEKLCLGQLKFSPLRAVSPNFLSSHPNPHIADFLALARSEHARYAPRLPTWTEYASDMANAVSQISTGREDAATALAATQQREQHSLDRQLERWDRLSPRLLAQWEKEP